MRSIFRVAGTSNRNHYIYGVVEESLVVKIGNVWYTNFMKIQVIISVLACKLTRFAIRLLGRGGTDFPGRVALKLCPNLLGFLAKDVTTILVTGTNGKTTTSRMIEQSLLDSGISFFANKSGANLLSGVTAEFAANSTWTGKCRYTHALIESDEAALKQISSYVDAKVIVVTNVFRDQLDRYGEVSHTLENLKIGISHSPNAVLCLNADDSLCTSLADGVQNPVIFYGVNTPVYENRVEELSDAPYCIHCKHEYVYDYVTYGHLGGYRCPNCGYQRPQPSVCVNKILQSDMDGTQVVFQVDDRLEKAKIHLPGGYNIYNACAAMTVGKALGLSVKTVAQSLDHFACGFGRMEKFNLGQAQMRMILIKNPAGCNQVLNFVTDFSQPFVFVVCLNDRAQDGKDVSWIWDVDFEQLVQMGDVLTHLYVSGIRAEDMAVRFLYAGMPREKITVMKDYTQLLKVCTTQENPIYCMPTYTAMLELRGIISKEYGYKNFWE